MKRIKLLNERATEFLRVRRSQREIDRQLAHLKPKPKIDEIKENPLFQVVVGLVVMIGVALAIWGLVLGFIALRDWIVNTWGFSEFNVSFALGMLPIVLICAGGIGMFCLGLDDGGGW